MTLVLTGCPELLITLPSLRRLLHYLSSNVNTAGHVGILEVICSQTLSMNFTGVLISSKVPFSTLLKNSRVCKNRFSDPLPERDRAKRRLCERARELHKRWAQAQSSRERRVAERASREFRQSGKASYQERQVITNIGKGRCIGKSKNLHPLVSL